MRPFPAAQWDALKEAFEAHVCQAVDLPSSHEATVFKFRYAAILVLQVFKYRVGFNS